MREESRFYRFLKWIGLIKTREIDKKEKKEMCENAKSICNKDCNNCIWNN